MGKGRGGVTENILVVDDHPLVLTVLDATVRAVFPAARVCAATSYEDALEAAGAGEFPELVLLECQREYARTGDECKFKECMRDASLEYQQAMAQINAQFQAAVDKIMAMSGAQQATQAGKEACDLF